MTQPPESEGTTRAWQRLWDEVRPEDIAHVDTPTLAEYAFMQQRYGPAIAHQRFPSVGRHLDSGCRTCEAELQHLHLAVRGMQVTSDDEDVTEPSASDTELGLADTSVLGLPGPLDVIARRLLMERIGTVLTGRERRIVQLRFGILDGRPHTLEEVAREFGVTRERIRQVEARAMRKLIVIPSNSPRTRTE